MQRRRVSLTYAVRLMPNLPANSTARNGVMKHHCNREAWQDINLRKQGNSNKIQMETKENGMYTDVYKMYTGVYIVYGRIHCIHSIV